MNFGELRDVVLAHVTRGQSSLQVNSTNLASMAIKNAILHVQRKMDLEWSKLEVSISCSPKGNIITGAVDSEDNPVKIKKILYALKGEGSHEAIPYLSRNSLVSEKTSMTNNPLQPVFDARGDTLNSGTTCAVIHEGQQVEPYPIPTTLPHIQYFKVVRLLPELSLPEDTNFLFDYGYDYLLYRSVHNLNFFLKEDQRFQISASMLSDAWDSLDQWNSELVSPTETEINL